MDLLVGILVLLALIGGIWFLVMQSKNKGPFGFGKILGTKCPRCAAEMPMARKPGSWQETLLGGWTCPNCGCKIDKYGRERST